MVERTLISLPSQLQLIERLQHLIYLSSSLIFVSGAVGSGKSTLTENLSNLLPSDLQQVYVSLSNVPTATKLRQQIVSQLFDKALFNAEDRLLDTIIRLQQTEHSAKNRLIIIDDVNHLPTDFILELCELFSNTDFAQNNTLNLLLLADDATNKQYLEYIETHLVSSTRSLLNHIELTLPVLSHQEANGLLQHNFQQVDYQAKLQHQDALNKQLKLCHGNPQKIIKLADDLSQGLLKPITNSWLRTRLPAILLMLFLVAIVSIFAVYLYPKFIPNHPTTDTLINSTEVILSESHIGNINMTSTAITTEEKASEKLAGSWANFDINIIDNESMVGLSDKTEKRVVISGQQLLELTVLSDSSDNQIIDLENSDKVAEEQQMDAQKQLKLIQHKVPLLLQQPLENSKKTTKYENIEPVSAALNVVSIQEQDLIQAANKQADNIQALLATNNNMLLEVSNSEPVDVVNKQLSSNVESTADTKTSVVVIEQAKETVVSAQKNNTFTATDILLSKTSTHYTIQLSGMASRQYLAEFQQQYNTGQEKNVFTYQTVLNNKPWFVVVYGDYPSMQSAQLAAKNLPGVFKNMSTWVKKWQVVHNDLRLNNE